MSQTTFREYKVSTQRIEFAIKEAGSPTGFPVLAIHGWLDNAATFDHLVKYLDLTNIRFIAFDLPGHGYSSHRPEGDIYHLVEYVVDCEALARALGISQCHVVGHSLGGIVAMFWASATNIIKRLVMIDSIGPYTGEASKVAVNLQEAINRVLEDKLSKKPVYDTIDKAIAARMNGIGKLSYEAAAVIVERGIQQVNGGFTWRSDARLTYPSLMRITDEQVAGFMSALEMPVLCILASQGLLAHNKKSLERLALIKNVTHSNLVGGHHLHLDGSQREVAQHINAFFEDAV